MTTDDLGDIFRAMRELNKERRARNLQAAIDQVYGLGGWMIHSNWHWSRMLNDDRLDYWPTKNKFRYQGKTMHGGIIGFITSRDKNMGDASTRKDEAQAHKLEASASIGANSAQLGDACNIGSPANTELVKKLVRALEMSWSKMYVNGIECKRLSDEALTEAQAWLEGQKGAL